MMLRILTALVVGLSVVGAGYHSASAIDTTQLTNDFNAKCIGGGAQYSESNCGAWYNGLTATEKSFVDSLFLNDGPGFGEASGSIDKQFPTNLGSQGTVNGRTAYKYFGKYSYFRRTSICVPGLPCSYEYHWIMTIRHYWCDDGYYIVLSCISSSLQSTGFWNENTGYRGSQRFYFYSGTNKIGTEIWVHTRYERRIHIPVLGTTIVRQYCDPEVTLRVYPKSNAGSYYLPGNDPTNQVGTHENCHLSL